MYIDKPIKGIFIDLDGTLADSAPDLSAALNACLGQLNLPKYSLETTRHWIGNGLDQLLNRALTNDFDGQADMDLLTQARNEFFSAYAEINGNNTKLFSGVKEALERFTSVGIEVACVTNKSRRFAIQLLEKLHIIEYFSTIVAGDDVVKKKPAPDAIHKALEYYQLAPDDCLMIGDSDNDVYAANEAGVDVLCVSYGYAQGVDLSKLQIAGIVDSINHIQLTANS